MKDPKKPRIRIIGPDELDGEDLSQEGTVFVTSDKAMREGGKLDVADYSVLASAAHGEGTRQVTPDEVSELAHQGATVFDELRDLARRGMKPRQARYIRVLRLDGHSWRSIAGLCHKRGWDWANWAPPSNQLAGMALCERAAELHEENYRKEPWN